MIAADPVDGGEVAGWLRANRWRLATRVDDELLDADPVVAADLAGLADVAGSPSEELVVNLVDTLGVAAGANVPELFLTELAWAKVLLAARGRAARDLEQTVDTLRRVLERELPPERFAALGPLLEVGAQTVPELPTDLPSEIDAASPCAPLVRRYLDALLTGDWRRAGRLVVDAADRGVPIETLYLDVLQVAEHEVGRLWLLDRISVAEEHYCSAVARQVLGLLRPRLFAPRGRGAGIERTLVAAAVTDEQHELGPRMVADLFDLAGWETFFLGANTPRDGLLDTAIQRDADIVALSASLTRRVPIVAELVRAIRSRAELAGVIILVGGHPFTRAPHLGRVIGADGSAASAADAVTLGERLIARRP